MNSYWQRKFHLEHKLSDGNIWHGFINIEADTEGDLPQVVSGTYWSEKRNDGWHGEFKLDNDEPYDRRKTHCDCGAFVIHTGIYRPTKEFEQPLTVEEAEIIYDYSEPVEYELIPRFDDRLENCIVSYETYYWNEHSDGKWRPYKEMVKLCPFCGCEASTFQIPQNTQEELAAHPEWKWNYPNLWIIGCETDGCFGCIHNMAMVFIDEKEAIREWNKRVIAT